MSKYFSYAKSFGHFLDFVFFHGFECHKFYHHNLYDCIHSICIHLLVCLHSQTKRYTPQNYSRDYAILSVFFIYECNPVHRTFKNFNYL